MIEPPDRPPTKRRVLLFAFGCMQTTLVAGILFGWASVATTLLIAPLDEGGAGLTMDETTKIFGLAMSTGFFSSLLLGYVLYVGGPRLCSVVSNIIIAIGCQVFAVSQTYRYFAIGACMMSFGSPGVSNAVIHIANLFPDSRFLVISCLSGSITLSFVILPIFDFLWNNYGMGLRAMFSSYVYVLVLCAIGALLLWPDTPFELVEDMDDKPSRIQNSNSPCHAVSEEERVRFAIHQQVEVPRNYFLQSNSPTQQDRREPLLRFAKHLVEAPMSSFLRSNSHHQLDRHESFILSREAIESGNLQRVSVKDLPFLRQLFSWIYLRILLVFISTSFMANFYVASLTTELGDQNYFSTDYQHQLAKIFTIICSFGILGSIVIGFLMDIIGLETCTALTLVTGILQILVLLVFSKQPNMLIVGFFLYSLFRQFLFPVYIACLTSKMGFKYNGILIGIGFTLSGIAQFYIADIVLAVNGTCHLSQDDVTCTHGFWRHLHFVQFVVLVFLLGVPAFELYSDKHRPSSRGTKKMLDKSDSLYGSTDSMSRHNSTGILELRA